MIQYFLRLFGSGRLPEQGRRVIEAEHVRLLEEQLVGSITFRHFRSPGKRSSWRRQWFLGSLALSDKRLLAYRYRSCLLNVPVDDARFGGIDLSAETEGRLSIQYEASLLHPADAGEIEICLHTPQAVHICATIASSTRKGRVRSSRRAPTR